MQHAEKPMRMSSKHVVWGGYDADYLKHNDYRICTQTEHVNPFSIIFLVFFALMFLITGVIDAEAAKAQGMPAHKFGPDTKHIVCGDMLCSEILHVKRMNMYFDSIRNNPDNLWSFFKQMPKGGDLHNHLAGSTHPEILIKVASDNNLCFDLDTAKLTENNNKSCPEGYKLVSKSYEDKSLYEFLLRSWSIHDFELGDRPTGHEHFFAVFGKIAQVNRDISTMLGFWKINAEEQNMQYMETMFNDPYIWSTLDELSQSISISNKSDFSDAYVVVLEEIQRKQIIEKSIVNISEYEENSTSFCMMKIDSCNVPFNYIFQVLRALEPDEVFVQMVLGFETASQSEHYVAINMVQPEDAANSLKYYDLHMEMLSFLSTKYPDVNITLHAGELWPSLDTLDNDTDMTFHIHDAIAIAGAKRIGHGVDIKTEVERYPYLLDMIRSNGVAVEINLSSNYFILGIEYDEHPILYYHDNDIPIVISTDDQGILLSNMTREYVTAATNYPQLDYTDFKNIVRNSLEHSFIKGRSLWVDSGTYEHQLPKCIFSNTNCWSITSDKKAVLQHELEQHLDIFENRMIDSKAN